ncbi:leucine-rich repeat domain-containing protein [Paenibacillus macquariensis]|uniref:Internalin A n=1 Tax=Paenibacillus macquariensis TaxID=948756 RepID=A0ABY1JVA3_9BACL|nr:hypothetical protein [Paenibacillus macquariensis]MEC0090822.1 hypothetical protein [Paenibacillus macquariensis]OAB34561.1 hypothetical protein PMSM_11910 [Paenibacillus macquariensis subsp. macquariensis]SIQ82880.1 hypothetical protein SAMN05421578_104244 [Paenibacillus macquariensis]
MSEVWIHAMHGVPWTPKKMKTAVEKLRRRATISFSFDSDKLEDLVKLDEMVLFHRPDLILHISSNRNKGVYSDEMLEILAGLKNVTALHLSMEQKQDLHHLQKLKNVEFLKIDSDQALSIDFISSFQKLQHLELIGKFDDLSPIGICKNLSSLILKCTIEQLNFIKETPIQYLLIDNCNVNCDLDVLNVPTLKMLELSSIAKLEDVSFLSRFEHLEFLSLSLSRVEKLCDFAAMHNLKQLKLDYMKSLMEIDVLKGASNLEILELKEINTKIKAEVFDFLLDMPRLKQLDFQYIDFNKKRIEIMRKKWMDSGKQDILVECMPEEKRQRTMDSIHLSRILM